MMLFPILKALVSGETMSVNLLKELGKYSAVSEAFLCKGFLH